MVVERPLIDEPVPASGPIGRLVFSPDGSLLAAARGFAIDLRDGTTGQPVRVLTGHAGEVWDVAFSPEGERLATVARDDTVKIWDVATGQVRRSYPVQRPNSVQFSPDGSRLGIAGSAGLMLLERSGEFTVWSPERALSGPVFAPNGTLVAALELTGGCLVFDAATGAVRLSLPQPGKGLLARWRNRYGWEDRLEDVYFTDDGSAVAARAASGATLVSARDVLQAEAIPGSADGDVQLGAAAAVGRNRHRCAVG